MPDSDEGRAWVKLAAVGVGALLSGPLGPVALAGLSLPVGELLDVLFARLDRMGRVRARALASTVGSQVAALAHNHDAGAVESARLTVTSMLSRFGLTDERFAVLALDPARAADSVLESATFSADERLEIAPLCRGLLVRFYEALVGNPDLLTDLLPHIHRRTLQRLDDISDAHKAEAARAARSDSRVEAMLAELLGEKDAKQRFGALDDAVRAALARLGEAPADPGEFRRFLERFVEDHLRLLDEIGILRSNDPDIARLADAVRSAAASFDYVRAQTLLGEARSLRATRRQRLEARLAAETIEEAALVASQGDVALARGRYVDAARYLAEAAQLVEKVLPERRIAYLELEAHALYRQGDEYGDNAVLIEATDRYRFVLELRPRWRVPLDWAYTQNELGISLGRLGERESGTAALKAAATAFRAALEEWTRERVPLRWAGTQNNLGNTLRVLGEREIGPASLVAAVAAYRSALEEWAHDRMPIAWAMTQNNLGNALATLGEREVGTARLHEALVAYRAALQKLPRDCVPHQWATTQNNLGNTLRVLGQRGIGTLRLRKAIVAFRGALEVWTRERMPFDWAGAHNNLGITSLVLGDRESGSARQSRLQEACTAFGAALEVWTRERAPPQWATTQNNLGATLLRLGERETGTTRLEAAAAAFRCALKEWTREQVPLDWAMVQENLGKVWAVLGERKRDLAIVDEAIIATSTARAVYVDEAQQTYRAPYFDDRLSRLRGLRACLVGGR